MKRRCNRCKKLKNISEFYLDRTNSTKYQYKCKSCDIISRRERQNKARWQKHLEALRKRCNYIKHDAYCYYGARGIKALISEKEIKKLWFRYKAYLMIKPSIDRINNNGNYTYENCRFIELGENVRRSNNKIVLQLDLQHNFIKEWDTPLSVTKKLGFCNSAIGCCARGKIKQAYGFIWKYKKKEKK